MISFGLVTEGLTDQIVIENILAGYFNSPDLDIRPLQPDRDKSTYGGWTLLFKYCQSSEFKQAFQSIDYIIIQIDTDVSEDYNIPKQDENGEFTPQHLIEKVIEKFRGAIGDDFYSQYQQKIIFAISVHSIECWLLPLYPDETKKSKVTNCLKALNSQLAKKDNFTIDANAKNPEDYRRISKQYRKHRVLMEHYAENPSLKIFIENIQSRDIKIGVEEEW
jgi:hypothetical protein